jgi:hypothetical protein
MSFDNWPIGTRVRNKAFNQVGTITGTYNNFGKQGYIVLFDEPYAGHSKKEVKQGQAALEPLKKIRVKRGS